MNIVELLGFSTNGWGKMLLLAMGVTLAVTFCAMLLGSVVAIFITWAKLSKNRLLRWSGEAYTTIFRGIPELLIIYLVYFGGSNLITSIGGALGSDSFIGIPPFLAGTLGVGLISAAYQTEVFRGAYLAISKGEIEAGKAVGMNRFLLFKQIIAPQVIRFAVPGLGNVWQLSIKDSALISVTGLAELMRSSQVAAGSSHEYFLFYIVGGVLYLVLTVISSQAFSKAEKMNAKSFKKLIV